MKHVYVLTEETNDGFSVIGVYETHALALAQKISIMMREFYDVSEEEVSDADIDKEFSDFVTYDIVQRKLVSE
jgi:hypothetical protein